MTRKCALCKATNYKQTYSFFSAPKDPEIRKKWQAVIPFPDYKVSDDTFVCSKHFRRSDIITHWVSGVPPHVVTIKYKKCRLRVGAVPFVDVATSDNQHDQIKFEQAGSNDGMPTDEIDFLIPKVKPQESIADNEADKDSYAISRIPQSSYDECHGTTKPSIRFMRVGQMQDSAEGAKVRGFDDPEELFDYDYEPTHEDKADISLVTRASEENSDNQVNSKLLNARTYRNVYTKRVLRVHSIKSEPTAPILSEVQQMEVDPLILNTEYLTEIDIPKDENISENDDRKSQRQDLGNHIMEILQCQVEAKDAENKPTLTSCDTMLFEDLLEIYTEVTLPRGWACLVTSKGRSTTVVYLYMNTPTNHIPVVEKEVYIKSDMIMHCGVGSKEIDLFLHGLIKDGRDNKVRTLSDIEELIDELDQRHICEGGPILHNFDDVEVGVAYIDGMKWRHTGCPIVINNGSMKCSKCVRLNGTIARRRNRTSGVSRMDMLLEKEKQIERLQRSLAKVERRNEKLKKSGDSFKNRVRLMVDQETKKIQKAIQVSFTKLCTDLRQSDELSTRQGNFTLTLDAKLQGVIAKVNEIVSHE